MIDRNVTARIAFARRRQDPRMDHGDGGPVGLTQVVVARHFHRVLVGGGRALLQLLGERRAFNSLLVVRLQVDVGMSVVAGFLCFLPVLPMPFTFLGIRYACAHRNT